MDLYVLKHLRRLLVVWFAVMATGPAHAAAAAPKCSLGLIDTLPILYAGMEMRPAIAASVNGEPTRAFIHLGGWNTELERAFVERLGLPTFETEDRWHGVGGSRMILKAKVKELKVGIAQTAGVLDLYDSQDSSVGLTVGSNLLLGTDLEISFADQYLKQYKPVNCTNEHLAYWDPNAVAIPFTGSGGYATRPLFKVRINGVELDAMFSTLSNASLIDTNAAKKLGIMRDSPGVAKLQENIRGLSGLPMEGWKVPLAEFAIGDEKVSNASMTMTDLNGVSEVILGLDFLRAHRVLISMSQETIYLSYVGGKLFSQTNMGEEKWFKQELERGNPDALYWVGYDDCNCDRSLPYMEKAAAQGHAYALDWLGKRAFSKAEFASSAAYLRKVFDVMPSNAHAAWHYLATMRSVDKGNAPHQLAADRARVRTDDFSRKIIDLYQGKMTADRLMSWAEAEKRVPDASCKARFHIAQAQLASGNGAAARPLLEAARDACGETAMERKIAAADLARLPQ